MVCKVCGYQTDNKVRFCPNCSSYFIDAEDPDSSIRWKGIISEEGVVSDRAHSEVVKTSASGISVKNAGRINAWAILAICFSATLLVINIIDAIADGGLFFMGIPVMIMAIISCHKSNRQKFTRIAILLIFLSIMVFAIRVLEIF